MAIDKYPMTKAMLQGFSADQLKELIALLKAEQRRRARNEKPK
jgi:hypothetical protein